MDQIKSGNYPRLLVSGSHGSAGKTTLTLGLISALSKRGLSVQPFKKGPDFIDPLWHSAASGRTCRNLDFFMMKDSIRSSFIKNATGAQISIIEGNKGLFDGIDTEGSDSTSALARHLEAPVLLVVDCYKMTRGIAPLIQGYLNFEKDLKIYLILNNVAGIRHEQKLRDAVSHYSDAEILGCIYRNPSLEIDERHLGLVPSTEMSQESETMIALLGESIEENVNIDRIIEIAQSIQEPTFLKDSIPSSSAAVTKNIRIGVAKDQAFTFYYPENLEALEECGADLIPFSPLNDTHLPDVDAVYIGGGFPEMYLDTIEKNHLMAEDLKTRVKNGLPIYAECGGLMYLSRSIKTEKQTSKMLNLIPAEIEMSRKPHGRGYMIFKTGRTDPSSVWSFPEGKEVRAHEFHYSYIKNTDDFDHYAYDVIRGYGIDGKHDGIIMNNIFASYVHLHAYAAEWWAESFVNAAKFFKKNLKNKTVRKSKEVFV
ncbi:MAG: hydrogenobyrinic acid a,c-diamide synthase (glutamine-hydrolyzing) [Spirochaetia bacterium]|nr:hydrogenobyrinic acid a,c-diamide synthase (glutamine-hydrolyzing) [Spirochaetia bacterium]